MPVGRDLIERFYAAFAAKADCCAPDVRFRDPVFQELRAAEAGMAAAAVSDSPPSLEMFTATPAGELAAGGIPAG